MSSKAASDSVSSRSSAAGAVSKHVSGKKQPPRNHQSSQQCLQKVLPGTESKFSTHSSSMTLGRTPRTPRAVPRGRSCVYRGKTTAPRTPALRPRVCRRYPTSPRAAHGGRLSETGNLRWSLPSCIGRRLADSDAASLCEAAPYSYRRQRSVRAGAWRPQLRGRSTATHAFSQFLARTSSRRLVSAQYRGPRAAACRS